MLSESSLPIMRIELMKEFIRKLEDIEEGDSDMFPYYMIDELKQEYLGIEPEDHE